MIEQLPDGVYLHLPFYIYLAQEGCLGSTDKSTLWLHREGWWWKKLSPYARPSAQSDEQLFGEVAHAAILEGMHAYESRYVVEPSKADYPDALFTIPQIKEALADAGVHVRGTGQFTKEDWADAAELHLPDRVVWDNVRAEFDRQQVHVTDQGERVRRAAIPAEMNFAVRAMHELAIEDVPGNELMRELMSVGSDFPILAEVSVFWTDAEGLRHRARFDKMLPVVTADMKTLGAWRGRPMVEVLDQHIKDSGHDVQLADYQIARRVMAEMILENPDCIHGGTEEERLHVEAMATYDQRSKPGWVWIFYQKPDASGRAPIILPVREPWGGPYHRAGYRKRHRALETYKYCMERFGPHRPWGRVEPEHWAIEEAPKGAPKIELGMHNWGPNDEAPGEREHFAREET